MHQAISLPGVAMRVFSTLSLIPQQSFIFLIQRIKISITCSKQTIFGGHSITFSRYHEAGKTFIQNNLNKPCQKIIGYDASALYLFAIGQKLGVGFSLV